MSSADRHLLDGRIVTVGGRREPPRKSMQYHDLLSDALVRLGMAGTARGFPEGGAPVGCDFWWRGSIPDPLIQLRVVEMYRAFFDPDREWPAVMPEPERRVTAIFGKSPLAAPSLRKGYADAMRESYPFNFFGVAAYFSHYKLPVLWSRGQVVFDRSDGGRFVSIVPDSLHSDYPMIARQDETVFINPGGYERLPNDGYWARYALFLVLLRLRYCPDLDARDDQYNIRGVHEALATGGFLEAAVQDELDYPLFIRRFMDYYYPPDKPAPPLGAESADSNLAAQGDPAAPGPELVASETPDPEDPASQVTMLINDSSRLSLSVDELELSVRTSSVLRRAGIKTIGQLTLLSQEDMKTIGLGKKNVAEVRMLLGELGFDIDQPGG